MTMDESLLVCSVLRNEYMKKNGQCWRERGEERRKGNSPRAETVDSET